MDPRERRTTTARTARLGFLLIGNLAAIFFLFNQCGGEAQVPADPAQVSVKESAAASGELLLGVDSLPEGLDMGLAPDVALLETPEPAPAEFPHLDPELAARIEGHISAAVATAHKKTKGKANASNCMVALSVLDARGTQLVQRAAQNPMRPASNMKLVTSAAALLRLGREGSFNTRFEASGEVTGGVLQGDLIVRAGGDPFYDPLAEGLVQHLFDPLLQALQSAGIREIQGDIVLDEGNFADPAAAPGWPSADQYWQEHCALAAGFSANAGCLTAFVVPTQVGSRARAELRPDLGGLERSGTVKTGSSKSRLDIAIGATSSKATLRGSIPASPNSWSQRFSHPDPVGLFGSVLRKALVAGQLTLRGGLRRTRDVPAGRELYTLRTPIVTVLEPINAESNNSVADQLFFTLGHQASGAGNRIGGQAAAKRALEQLGVSAEGLIMADGSGLSRDNRVTAAQLTQLLHSVALEGGPIWSLYLGSLAVSGEKGSLERRMQKTPAEGRVYAKTGWINGTSALSGYVKTESGEMLCFSLLVNYPNLSGLNTSCWKPLGNKICAELAQWKSKRPRVK